MAKPYRVNIGLSKMLTIKNRIFPIACIRLQLLISCETRLNSSSRSWLGKARSRSTSKGSEFLICLHCGWTCTHSAPLYLSFSLSLSRLHSLGLAKPMPYWKSKFPRGHKYKFSKSLAVSFQSLCFYLDQHSKEHKSKSNNYDVVFFFKLRDKRACMCVWCEPAWAAERTREWGKRTQESSHCAAQPLVGEEPNPHKSSVHNNNGPLRWVSNDCGTC